MVYRGQVSIDDDDPVSCSIELGKEAMEVDVDGEVIVVEYVDIEDVVAEDHVLLVTDWEGGIYTFDRLGRAFEQVAGDLRKFRASSLERHLFLRGVGRPDTFPTMLLGDEEDERAEVVVFEDSIVVRPQHSRMFGLPLSFVSAVSFDHDDYTVRIETDDGEAVELGRLGTRSTELEEDIVRAIERLDARTCASLAALTGRPKGSLEAAAPLFRDGRSAFRRDVAAADTRLWPLIEKAVGDGPAGLGEAYEFLRDNALLDAIAAGVKGVRSMGEDPDEEAAPTPEQSDTWFFTPLTRKGRLVNLIAQEVTSSSGHATYLFRVLPPKEFGRVGPKGAFDAAASSIAVLNRALLQLNFRREPLYLDEEEMTSGKHARYRAALRHLPHLRFARLAYVARVPHTKGWAATIGRHIKSA